MNDTIWATESFSGEANNASTSQSYKTSRAPVGQLSSDKLTVVLKCMGLVLIAIFGIFGNILTLVAIRKTPSLWTKSNMLLAYLTSTHLYMSVLQLPFFAAFNLWVYVFAENSCYYFKVAAALFPVTKIVANAIFCQFIIIAVDRYIAIIYPLHYETKMTVTVIKCLTGGSFLFGLAMVAIFFQYLQYIDFTKCGTPYSPLMTAVIDCTVLFAVMLVTILVYGRVLLVALKHRSKIAAMNTTVQEISVSPISDPAAVPSGKTEKPKIKKTLKEFKAARMTAVLVCAYTLPLLPYEIGRIMQACGNFQSYTVKLVDVGAALGNLNTGFDWVIYGIMNRTFRQAFYKILKIKTDDPNRD